MHSEAYQYELLMIGTEKVLLQIHMRSGVAHPLRISKSQKAFSKSL